MQIAVTRCEETQPRRNPDRQTEPALLAGIIRLLLVVIVGETGPSDPNRLALATKHGWEIPNTRRRPIAPQIQAEAVKFTLGAGTDRQLRSKSSEYNCLGMVFAARRCWVDTEHLDRILREDGYRRVGAPEVMVGDLVVYRDEASEPNHIGLVCRKDPDLTSGTYLMRVLSQWGSSGEYFHWSADVSPLFGTRLEYWTDRL